MSRRRNHDSYAAAIIATLIMHVGLGAGLYAAGELIDEPKREPPTEIEILPPRPKVAKAKPEPKPPPAVKPPPPPPLTKPVTRTKAPPPRRPRAPRVAKAQPPPATTTPTPPVPENTTPAPGPPDTDESAETFRLPETGGSGAVPVARGKRGGRGGPGGKGKGTGGGGPPTSTGTGPARGPVSVATIKTMPKPLADPNYKKSDYPAEAKRRKIEGQVKVRLVVGISGRVTSRRVVKKLGYGLDQWALRLAKGLRFSAAIDTDGKKVPAVVVYTFTFVIPR